MNILQESITTSLRLQILTPQKSLFDEEVDSIIISSNEGEMEILHNHMPIIAVVVPCIVKIRKNSQNRKEWSFSVKEGLFWVENNKCVLLSDDIIPQSVS